MIWSKNSHSKTLSWLFLLLINALVFLVFVELASRTFINPWLESRVDQFIVKDAEWYTRFLPFKSKYKADNYRGVVPHPLWGFSSTAGGFEENSVLDPKNRDKEFRVGIFGGSVAENLAYYNEESRIIEEKLKQIPALKNKEIVVVRFALGGYKQPQSLNIASVHGEAIDFAINLEGINELVYNHGEKFPFYFPTSAVSKLYFSSLNTASHLQDLIDNVITRGLVAEKLVKDNYWLGASKLIDQITYLNSQISIQSIHETVNDERRLRSDETQGVLNYSPEKALRAWLKYSCMQQNILAMSGVKGLFFIQPVPFLYKKLTSQEESYLEDFKRLYEPVLESLKSIDTSQLKGSNFSLIDLMKTFENVDDEVYVDGCCHLNSQGKKILLSKIMEIVVQTIEAQEPIKECQWDQILKHY